MCGVSEVESLEGGVENMAGHIAECAGAEIPPAAEVPGVVAAVIRTFGGRTEESIPVECRRYFLRFYRTRKALRPDRTVGECVDTGHFTDFAVPNPVADFAHTVARSALVTHLGGYFVFVGKTGEQTRLVNGMCERLLAVYMFAGYKSVGRDDCMGVVGSSYYNSICILEHFVVHTTVVVVTFCVGISAEDVVGILPVYVAEADDVFLTNVIEHGSTATTDAYAENIEFVAGSCDSAEALTKNRTGHHGHCKRGHCTGFEELSPC